MKKNLILTVVIMLMAVVATAQAEVRAGSFSVTPFIGGHFFAGNEDFKNTTTFGLRTGYNFTKNWGVEGFLSYAKTEIEDIVGKPNHNMYGYGIEGLFHFLPESRLVPFLAVGIGGIHHGYPTSYRGDRFAFDYGAGLKYFLTDDIALRTDVRYLVNTHRYNDLLVTCGITFSFGGKKKIVVEARTAESFVPVETVTASRDEDLADPVKIDITNRSEEPADPVKVVIATKDNEPVVPAEVVVAPITEKPVTPVQNIIIDSDNDGVPDFLDKCPGTLANMAVDENGCSATIEKKQEAQSQEVTTPVAAKPLTENASISLNVKFDTAKAVVKKKYYKQIKKLADFMKNDPTAKFVIEGHADSINNKGKNLQLSQERAESVRQYLIKHFGIDGSRITAVGYGSTKPIASNDKKKGRQKNRRADAVIETEPKE